MHTSTLCLRVQFYWLNSKMFDNLGGETKARPSPLTIGHFPNTPSYERFFCFLLMIAPVTG